MMDFVKGENLVYFTVGFFRILLNIKIYIPSSQHALTTIQLDIFAFYETKTSTIR